MPGPLVRVTRTVQRRSHWRSRNSAGAHLALLLQFVPNRQGSRATVPIGVFESGPNCSSTPTKPRFRKGKGRSRRDEATCYELRQCGYTAPFQHVLPTRMAPVSQMDEYVKALREKLKTSPMFVMTTAPAMAYVQHLQESRRSRETFIRTLMNKGN